MTEADKAWEAVHIFHTIGRVRAACEASIAEAIAAHEARWHPARELDDHRQVDVFKCRYCGYKVDFLKPYHSDEQGLWHWEGECIKQPKPAPCPTCGGARFVCEVGLDGCFEPDKHGCSNRRLCPACNAKLEEPRAFTRADLNVKETQGMNIAVDVGPGQNAKPEEAAAPRSGDVLPDWPGHVVGRCVPGDECLSCQRKGWHLDLAKPEECPACVATAAGLDAGLPPEHHTHRGSCLQAGKTSGATAETVSVDSGARVGDDTSTPRGAGGPESPALVITNAPNCSECGAKMGLAMWDRPGGPPGNGWRCLTCHPLPSPSPPKPGHSDAPERIERTWDVRLRSFDHTPGEVSVLVSYTRTDVAEARISLRDAQIVGLQRRANEADAKVGELEAAIDDRGQHIADLNRGITLSRAEGYKAGIEAARHGRRSGDEARARVGGGK